MDHSQALGTCASCHNGTKATGKPPTHIPTTADCGSCHKTIAWLPATFDHAGVTGNCATCHNGAKATGKPANHFVTTVDCVDCHRTAAWLPVTNYLHKSASYPGTHSRPLACNDCHTTNSQTVPYPSAAYAPNCAGCHANNFRAGSHPKWESPTKVNYTVSELRDCTGACHIYTNSSMTTIKERRNSHHRVSSGSF
jgi:Cytochrome c3